MANLEIGYVSAPVTSLAGDIHLPGDKSISHRALLLSALAEGTSNIHNLLLGQDNLATLTALRQLGVDIQLMPTSVIVYGKGLASLQKPEAPLDLGNSGTGLRLLAGILAGQNFSSELIGDASLCKRPMARIVEPLRAMGASIEMSGQGTPPLYLTGKRLKSIYYSIPVASAQVKSCLLLAGLYADGQTTVTEPALSRDHTERMLQQFAYPIEIAHQRVSLSSGHRLHPVDIMVPGDISSAAFFMVAASVVSGSTVRLRKVGINPTRTGIIHILRLMGADITLESIEQECPEPIADIIVRGSSLKGITIPKEHIVTAIDEFPVIFIAAACAKGQTILHGAEELRVKESDRIQTMATGLSRLGIDCTVLLDGLIIKGGKLKGGHVDSGGDHRVAMAFAVAGCVSEEPILIDNCEHVATSFPNFLDLAQEIGMQLKVND